MELLTLPPVPDATCGNTQSLPRRPSLPLAHPAQLVAEPARVPVTFRPGHRDAGLSLSTLHQLQDQWDGEAAHLNVRRFRLIAPPVQPINARAELPGLAALLVLAPLALLAFALVTP